MFERFTKDVRRVVLLAAEETSLRRGDPRLGTEHLLYGVVANGDAWVADYGLTVDRIRSKLADLDVRALESVGIEAAIDEVPPSPVRRRRRFLLPRHHVPFTAAAKRALERSLHICLAEGHKAISPTHLLAALAVAGGNDPAVRLLRSLGVEPAELDTAIRRSWRQAS